MGKAQGGAEARQGAPAGGREEPKKGDPRAGPWQAFRVGAGSKGSREAIPPVAGAAELGFSASWGCHKSPRRAFVTVTKGRTCPLRVASNPAKKVNSEAAGSHPIITEQIAEISDSKISAQI